MGTVGDCLSRPTSGVIIGGSPGGIYELRATAGGVHYRSGAPDEGVLAGCSWMNIGTPVSVIYSLQDADTVGHPVALLF